MTTDVVIVPLLLVDPRANPWDAGIPKSILRSRRSERHDRVVLMARINERRCDDPYAPTQGDAAFDTSMPTPDLVHFLTASLLQGTMRARKGRQESSKKSTDHQKFANGAWVACQRAIRMWPNKQACSDADGPPNYQRHPTDVIGGLNATGLQTSTMKRLQRWYGPEASFVSTRESTPKALREMLLSPADCVDYFATDLSK